LSLPRSSIPDLIDDLRELARASFVDTFPDLEQDEMAESEVADLLVEVEKLLLDIVSDGGPFAERARAILSREE
jgi:hypothetical protein